MRSQEKTAFRRGLGEPDEQSRNHDQGRIGNPWQCGALREIQGFRGPRTSRILDAEEFHSAGLLDGSHPQDNAKNHQPLSPPN